MRERKRLRGPARVLPGAPHLPLLLGHNPVHVPLTEGQAGELRGLGEASRPAPTLQERFMPWRAGCQEEPGLAP